jgi:hypothetical protein
MEIKDRKVMASKIHLSWQIHAQLDTPPQLHNFLHVVAREQEAQTAHNRFNMFLDVAFAIVLKITCNAHTDFTIIIMITPLGQQVKLNRSST